MSKLDALPHVVNPDRAFWRGVSLLAGARRAGNAAVSFPSYRSRGADGDVRTELMGTFGELAVWLWAETAGVECAPPTILSMTGPPRDIDFHITVDGLRIGLEAKAWTPTKLDGSQATRININVEGHKRSRKRGGEQYIFIFGELGGGRAVVTAIVPHEEVDGWTYDAGPFGDPMVYQSIGNLAPRVLAGRSSDALRVYLSEVEPAATYEELKAWRGEAATHIDGIVSAIQQETSPSTLLARLDSLR